MSILQYQTRRGAYADSIVLMQLQSALAGLSDIEDAGVVMATAANLDLLRANDLLPDPVPEVGAEDLLLVVRAASNTAAEKALEQVDSLMERRSSATAATEFRAKSLRGALNLLPGSGWVLISVPGRYAAGVVREALEQDQNVFLYSDNVALEEEVALKTEARKRGLLVMGPDCGTATIDGVGLGFANRVRQGAVGLVAASGTGLQAIASRVHALGSGVSQALGTGGRDLSGGVGAITTLQGLEFLARDDSTRVIVLVSKPPEPKVAVSVLRAAARVGKPVVVAFQGFALPLNRLDNLYFARGLSEAADLAVDLVSRKETAQVSTMPTATGFLRGLFSGGTLALECLAGVAPFLEPLYSNLKFGSVLPLTGSARSARSRGHTILDLGADEYTVGRLHPMIDPELRVRRLRQEAADPATGVILLDVVLGEGSHPDPAGALAPAIEEIRQQAVAEVICLVVGTDEDPQGLEEQVAKLESAGANVHVEIGAALVEVVRRLRPQETPEMDEQETPRQLPRQWRRPFAAINVGLESFYESLIAQGAEAVHVEWRPPAGGNEHLMSILEKMKS